MFDDDAARFQKIVLAMPEPSRLLPVYEAARAALMARHEDTAQTHAVDNTWAQEDEAVALKRDAKDFLEKKTVVLQSGPLGGCGGCIAPGRRAAGDSRRGPQDLRPSCHARIAGGEVTEGKNSPPP